MIDRIKRKFKEWRCQLFHDHEMVKPFWMDRSQYLGCRKCDLWRYMGDCPIDSN